MLLSRPGFANPVARSRSCPAANRDPGFFLDQFAQPLLTSLLRSILPYGDFVQKHRHPFVSLNAIRLTAAAQFKPAIQVLHQPGAAEAGHQIFR